MYISNKVEVRKTQKGKSLFALDNILKDEVIFEFEKTFLDHPTKTSMQIDENVHQESEDPNSIENFLNHSCEPTGYIDFKDLTCKAYRNIRKGEELTYNYLTTEWDFANKFKCECGSKKCYRELKGFKYLSIAQKEELKDFLSPYLRKKLKEEQK